MNLKLDHVFILVDSEAKVADLLLENGFCEGPGNTHPGQGTANRRFYFANGMLEFIWVRDADEARKGPGRNLHFAERAEDLTASPFGIIFVPGDETAGSEMPFPGWHYQPSYFPAPRGFHVGSNSHNVIEPLCFYFPHQDPGVPIPQPNRNPQTISEVIISTPSLDTEGVFELDSQADHLSMRLGQDHLMEIILDQYISGQAEDYRPEIPLILKW